MEFVLPDKLACLAGSSYTQVLVCFTMCLIMTLSELIFPKKKKKKFFQIYQNTKFEFLLYFSCKNNNNKTKQLWEEIWVKFIIQAKSEIINSISWNLKPILSYHKKNSFGNRVTVQHSPKINLKSMGENCDLNEQAVEKIANCSIGKKVCYKQSVKGTK